MRVMQSSPFCQCMVRVGCAPAVCGVPTGSCQGMCVGALWKDSEWRLKEGGEMFRNDKENDKRW